MAWGVCDLKILRFLILKYFLHTRGSHNNYQNKIFIIIKVPPPHEKGESYEEGKENIW
jgi:hypothetical protein